MWLLIRPAIMDLYLKRSSQHDVTMQSMSSAGHIIGQQDKREDTSH